MNIWIGTDLAADILGSVKDTPGDKVAQVIVKNANEPYYKGICSDAKRCGVEIITAEKLVHNCTYPTISLNPYIRVPDAINLDGVKFVKLDEDAHASFVLTADVFPKHIPFEHKDAERKDHDNFVGSYLQKHVDIWLHQGHPNISKAVVERPINLLSMCGETVYGTPCVFGRVLTLDEYRRYRKYIPLASDWYWLATSYSPFSGRNNYAYHVYADGSVSYDYVFNGGYYCARPALYLESSILVSVEVETDDIEKMQDKVTALQRETLTACKNAELIAELFRRIPGVQED